MKTKDTIKDCLMNHPALYSNVADVMDHLFLTIGNGYDWFCGELVEKESFVPSIKRAFEKLKSTYNENYIIDNLIYSKLQELLFDPTVENLDDVYNYILKRVRKNTNNLINRAYQIATVDEIMNKPLELESTYDLYPLSEYSSIMNIPDDITDDWKQCAKRFYDWLMTSEFDYVVEWRSQYGEMLKTIEYKLV